MWLDKINLNRTIMELKWQCGGLSDEESLCHFGIDIDSFFSADWIVGRVESGLRYKLFIIGL